MHRRAQGAEALLPLARLLPPPLSSSRPAASAAVVEPRSAARPPPASARPWASPTPPPPPAVQLKVLTGDSLEVSRQVCAQVGLPVRHAITGAPDPAESVVPCGQGAGRAQRRRRPRVLARLPSAAACGPEAGPCGLLCPPASRPTLRLPPHTPHRSAGPELARLGASEFCEAARRATVLAKLTPGQKARPRAARALPASEGGSGVGLHPRLVHLASRAAAAGPPLLVATSGCALPGLPLPHTAGACGGGAQGGGAHGCVPRGLLVLACHWPVLDSTTHTCLHACHRALRTLLVHAAAHIAVGFLGDGANDGPALRNADVGGRSRSPGLRGRPRCALDSRWPAAAGPARACDPPSRSPGSGCHSESEPGHPPT